RHANRHLLDAVRLAALPLIEVVSRPPSHAREALRAPAYACQPCDSRESERETSSRWIGAAGASTHWSVRAWKARCRSSRLTAASPTEAAGLTRYGRIGPSADVPARSASRSSPSLSSSSSTPPCTISCTRPSTTEAERPARRLTPRWYARLRSRGGRRVARQPLASCAHRARSS